MAPLVPSSAVLTDGEQRQIITQAWPSLVSKIIILDQQVL